MYTAGLRQYEERFDFGHEEVKIVGVSMWDHRVLFEIHPNR